MNYKTYKYKNPLTGKTEELRATGEFLNSPFIEKENWVVDLRNGNIMCFNDKKQIHRDGDSPAHWDNNTKCISWYKEGELHRYFKPAREFKNGDEHWYENGLCTREDGPAITSEKGNILIWQKDSQRHRTNGPAYVDFKKKEYLFYLRNDNTKGPSQQGAFVYLNDFWTKTPANKVEVNQQKLDSLVKKFGYGPFKFQTKNGDIIFFMPSDEKIDGDISYMLFRNTGIKIE